MFRSFDGEKSLREGGRASLYRTLSALSGVGELVDTVAGLYMLVDM